MEPCTPETVELWLGEHQAYFESGQTRPLAFRLQQLRILRQAIKQYEPHLLAALQTDLHKSEFEAYTTEIGFTLSSITHTIRKLGKWMKPRRVKTPIHLQPAKSLIIPEPYGTVLIIGPFNYPVQLLLEPLVGAISAGNCAVLKPSEHTPHVAGVIRRMVEEFFDPAFVRVVEGEVDTVQALIHGAFDYIFFTGSVAVGKIVMAAAAKRLVPVTLELGGKSPVIVDKSANLAVAARRIMWGKLVNAGQTCIAPDYVLVAEELEKPLIQHMRQAIVEFYGSDVRQSGDYGRIVNDRQFSRLAEIVERDRKKVVYGGGLIREEKYIEPTLLADVTWNDACMEGELFGPILPVLTFGSLEEAIRTVREQPKPLALYLFTENNEAERMVMEQLSFGGGCVNDTIYHVASAYLPFGGVGNAGIGAYHGQASFDTFTHRKSILKRGTRLNLKLAFPPYGDKVRLIRKLLK